MIFSVNVTKSAVSFTQEILNGKPHFLCSVSVQVASRVIYRFKLGSKEIGKFQENIKIGADIT